jgi:hypothetical protein
MPCCGQTRTKETIGASQSARIAAAVPNRRPVYGAVGLEYTGRASLTVIGPVTGARYLFPFPGARVQVNGLDSVALAAVRLLRRV